jgi:hypothetical protein
MPRSNPPGHERGSASLLFAVVVVPLLLLFMSVGIEVSQFLGMREEVLEYLDAEMLAALRSRDGKEQIAERVRGRLDRLRPYMTVEEVGVTVRGPSVEGRVRGRYRGPLIQVASHLAGRAGEGIPLEVLSFARRPRSAALLVLDRTVPEGAEPCGDSGLIGRALVISKIAEQLTEAGVATVRLAVLPGVDGAVDVLKEGDRVPRCPGNSLSQFAVQRVEGTAQDALPDSLTVALQTVEGALALSSSESLERRTVIMVGTLPDRAKDFMTTALSLLENEASRQRLVMDGIGIAVGGSDEDDLFTSRSPSGRSVLFQITDRDLQASTLMTVLSRHTQGQGVIAR